MFSSYHAGFGVISIWACGFECSSVAGAPLRNFSPTHPPHSGGFSQMPIRSLLLKRGWCATEKFFRLGPVSSDLSRALRLH